MSRRNIRPQDRGLGFGKGFTQSMGMGAMAAPGMLLIGVAMAFATVLVFVATALFPVGGGLILASYAAFYYGFFVIFVPNTSWIMALMAFFLPGFFLFAATMALEDWLAGFKAYRIVRYFWRVLGIAFIAWGVMIIAYGDRAPVTAETPWSEALPMNQRIAIGVGLVSAHFISRRLDRNYKGMNRKLAHVFAGRVPKFKTSVLECDDDEVRRRLQIYRDALVNMEEAGKADSKAGADLRFKIEDLTKVLENRERRRQGLA